MKDEILKNYVKIFSQEREISDLEEPDQFERFVNFCVISRQYPRDFDFETLSVGGGQDSAIDGAAIIVNGNIVESPEEIDFFIKNNGSLDVSFSLIQSKSSSSFSGSQITNFLAGIKNLFSEESYIPENEDIRNLRAIKKAIYNNSIKLDDLPTLDLNFVTTGQWKEPEHITGLINSELSTLKEKSLFSNIEFHCIDAEKLKELYRETQKKIVKDVEFPSAVTLPQINGVRQALVGNLSAKEYLKLITDSDENLQKNIFYDNVRDFQGSTKVNKEIERTLKSGDGQAAISIFNNGITIIAKKVERIGSRIKLTDYQIVNGCQTSHVLFANKALLQDNSHIVLKVIETTDWEIAVSVIKATNRQTEVKIEAFESLSPFHKDLEEYYKSQASVRKRPIYYERRSKQYESTPNIVNSQVTTLSGQIKSYVSACLAQPQSTHRYYGEILESNRERMFNIGDSLEKYYLSASILNRVEGRLRNKISYKKYRQFKYHIVFLLYEYYTSTILVKRKPNWSEIFKALDDNAQLWKLIDASIHSIDSALSKTQVSTRDAVRSKALTDNLVKELTTSLAQAK